MSDVKLIERQAKLISIISALSKKPISSTLLQKTIFLCLEQVKSCDLHYSYKIGHFGPFSKDLMDDLEDLEKRANKTKKRNASDCHISNKRKMADCRKGSLRV